MSVRLLVTKINHYIRHYNRPSNTVCTPRSLRYCKRLEISWHKRRKLYNSTTRCSLMFFALGPIKRILTCFCAGLSKANKLDDKQTKLANSGFLMILTFCTFLTSPHLKSPSQLLNKGVSTFCVKRNTPSMTLLASLKKR